MGHSPLLWAASLSYVCFVLLFFLIFSVCFCLSHTHTLHHTHTHIFSFCFRCFLFLKKKLPILQDDVMVSHSIPFLHAHTHTNADKHMLFKVTCNADSDRVISHIIINRLKIPQGLSTLLFRWWSEVPSRGGVHCDSPYCFTDT